MPGGTGSAHPFGPVSYTHLGEQKYDFPVLTTGKGNLFYPIFTDLDELSKWTEEKDSGSVVLSFVAI